MGDAVRNEQISGDAVSLAGQVGDLFAGDFLQPLGFEYFHIERRCQIALWQRAHHLLHVLQNMFTAPLPVGFATKYVGRPLLVPPLEQFHLVGIVRRSD
jgi:hypothetical protein